MRLQIVEDKATGKFFLRDTMLFGLIGVDDFIDRQDFRNGKIDTWSTHKSAMSYCSFHSLEEIEESIEMFRKKNPRNFLKLKVIKTIKV